MASEKLNWFDRALAGVAFFALAVVLRVCA